MLTIHKTTIVGKCPHGCPDVYQATFQTNRLIPVETIQAEINKATAEPIYQETLTQLLADRVGCIVTTIGDHGGFRTECIAEPEE